jgi:hypothetical protein
MKKTIFVIFVVCAILSTPALSEKIRILYDDIYNSYNKDDEEVEQKPDDSEDKKDESSDHSEEKSDNSDENSNEHND